MQVGRCWRIFLAQHLTKMLLALPKPTEGESGSVFPAKEAAPRLWWSRPKGCWMFAWAVRRICNQWLCFLLKLSVSRGGQGTPRLLAGCFFVFHRNVAFVAKVTKFDTCWCLGAQGWADSNLCLHRQIALLWLGGSLVLERYIGVIYSLWEDRPCSRRCSTVLAGAAMQASAVGSSAVSVSFQWGRWRTLNVFPVLQFNIHFVNDEGGCRAVLEMQKVQEIAYHFTQLPSGLITLPLRSAEVSPSLQLALNVLISFSWQALELFLDCLQLQHLAQVSSYVRGFAMVFWGKACQIPKLMGLVTATVMLRALDQALEILVIIWNWKQTQLIKMTVKTGLMCFA